MTPVGRQRIPTTVGVPLLIAKHDELSARRRAASQRLSRVGASRTEQLLGLLMALIFPLFCALAWPFLEPALDAMFGNQARAVSAKLAPYFSPLVRRGERTIDSAVPLWHELAALARSGIGPAPWRARK